MNIQAELLREPFEKAKPIAGDFADIFYENLWQNYPESKALFSGVKMAKQKKALIGSSVNIVDNLKNTEELVGYLKSIGKRQEGNGAQPEHYEWVCDSLLSTFAHFFAEDWTDELNSAWAEAYKTIAAVMLEGAEEIKPSNDLIRSKAENIAGKLLMQVVDDSMDEQVVELVRTKVRKVIFEVLEEEAEELLSKKVA